MGFACGEACTDGLEWGVDGEREEDAAFGTRVVDGGVEVVGDEAVVLALPAELVHVLVAGVEGAVALVGRECPSDASFNETEVDVVC